MRDGLPRHLLIAFLLAVSVYGVAFSCDQALRRRKGPWEVTFGTNVQGFAMIIVNEPTLGIMNKRVTFLGERPTNSGVVRFDAPLKPIPFGRTKFEDLTYLPGSVAFDFFGHEVELLPRTLYLNKQEHSWSTTNQWELEPGAKLPPGSSYDPRKKKRKGLMNPK